MREWTTVGEIHRELGFDKSAILRCCKGKQQRSYWFIWRFKDAVKDDTPGSENESKSKAPSTAVQETEDSCQKRN